MKAQQFLDRLDAQITRLERIGVTTNTARIGALGRQSKAIEYIRNELIDLTEAKPHSVERMYIEEVLGRVKDILLGE